MEIRHGQLFYWSVHCLISSILLRFQKEDETNKNIIEIDAERDKVLKETAEKKGTDWVISQLA